MSFSIGSISEAVSNPIFNSQKPAEDPINKFPVPSGDGKENIGTLSQMAYMLSGTVLFGQKGPF